MDIWEPCNYASNLAYDRLMFEMCLQEDWAFSPQTVGVNARVFYLSKPYLIIVIFFTLTQFLENKIYTEKRQFFALNL